MPFGAPLPTNSKDVNVGKISTKECWDIDDTLATRITLTWNKESEIDALIDNGSSSKLFIVGWNGTKWVNIPPIIDTNALLCGQSNLTTGSVTTAFATAPFTYILYTFGTEITTSPRPTARVQSKNFILIGETDLFIAERAPLYSLKESSQSGKNYIILYPNPARDQVFILANDNTRVRYVVIYNL